ncbi:MAG: hypothetical protein JSW03_02165, partial [Candidatus Eiseniibacteriota bacterium]
LEPNVFELPGDTKLTDLSRVTNLGLRDPRMTTIAGVVFRHLDRLPQVGDQVTIDDLTITVTEMDAHRIARVRIRHGVTEEENGESQTVESESAEGDEKKADGESGRNQPGNPGSPDNASQDCNEDTES